MLNRPQNKHLKPAKLGEVRNPAGRPQGSRNKFSEEFLSDFMATWEEHGKAVLEHVATNYPSVFLRVAAQVLPRDLNLDVSKRDRPVQELSDEELTAIIRDSQAQLAGMEEEDGLRTAINSHVRKPA